MPWNYRVVRHRQKDEEWFTIRDIYYRNGGGEATIYAWGADARAPWGATRNELHADLELMYQALDKPTLNEEDLPG